MKLHTVLVGGTWARRDLGPALGGRGLCGHGLVHGPVRHELKFLWSFIIDPLKIYVCGFS